MRNSSTPRSPPYPFYAPSSPPWSPFPIVTPITNPIPPQTGFGGNELNSAPNLDSERSLGEFHSRSVATVQNPLPLDADGDDDVPNLRLQSVASEVASGSVVTSPCESQSWHMQQPHECMDMDDTIGLGQEMLEANGVFDESIEDPQATSDVQQSPERDVDAAETSGREGSNVFLIKVGSEPYIGLEFRSEGEAYEYYKAYAKENGFCIRKSHVERSRVDHSLISRKFVCVKQGVRSLKDKRYEGKVVRHRRVTRVDCRAAMIIKRRSGKWTVHRFHKDHNHDLGDLMKANEHQSQQKVATSTKSILEALYKTQCIDIEDNISLGKKISEGNRLNSEKSFLDPQTTIDVQDFAKEDVSMAERSGREGNTMQESPNGDVSTAETNGREKTDASLIKLGSEPCIGLQFDSQEEAYEFYNAYAKEKGFSIRKSRIERSRIDHSLISRLFVCAHQGLRSTKDKRYEGKVVRPRQETRLDCRAAMFIKKRSAKWVVERFHKEHNHDLVDPLKTDKLRSHRKMTMATKSIVEALYKCGVGPAKIVELITGMAEGAKDFLGNSDGKDVSGNNEADCESNTKKERKNNIRVECYHLLEYFQELQAADPGFFYAVEFGENQCLRSIFWVDSKARDAYKQFGDVLVFDTVCRTNKYLYPFAAFTGVNHHRQSVLFGCGFLADETMESFVWMFESWLRAMSNRQPTSIITNQDRALKLAIQKVFPETGHRFCMWQIEKEEVENLTHVFDMHINFRAEYKRCIYSSQTPKEFESGWEALLLKYNLKDNKWLHKLFNQRDHWVPLYLRGTFFGGLITTHKSDGIKSYFDGFLYGETPFSKFVAQYEQAVKQHRQEEADEDFLTVFSRSVLTSKNPIEEHAGSIYTRNMFKIFEHEFVESSGCIARMIGEEGPISKYLVGKYREKDDKMHIVAFDPTDNSASCSCQMFDSEGMLCRHVLKVFQVVNIFEIPPQYILNRWTMSDNCVESCVDETEGGSLDPNPHVWTLKDKTKDFVELGETSKERINIAIDILEEGMAKLSVISVPTVTMETENLGYNSIQGEKINEQSEIWMMDLNTTVPDPSRAKQKGRPVSSRIKLGSEQSQKKKRTCGTCKEIGHYTRTCPKGVEDQSQTSIMLQEHVDHLQTSQMLQGPIGQSQSSNILQGPGDHSGNSGILQEPHDQSQTSMMLQEPFGQPQIFEIL